KALEEAVEACRRPLSHRGGDDQGLWTRVQNYMRNVKGYDRTDTSCRIKWGRDHRHPTGWDERNHKRVRNPELRTSVQKRKRRSGSKTDRSPNPDEDDNDSPPKKKVRKQKPAESSSARKAPAATSSMNHLLPPNILRPPSIYPYAMAPPLHFEPARR